MATFSEIDVPASIQYAVYGDQPNLQGDQDIQSTSQESTDNSPLEFAPFIPLDPSDFDYDPAIYDSLLPPTELEWDMANTWMPSFAPDMWASADLIVLPADASMESLT
jgi:hypothetical protein